MSGATRVFGEIFNFEWRFRLRQGTFWLYCGVFFLLTFAAASTDAVQIGGAIGKVARNAPFVIVSFLTLMSAIGVIVTTALVATAVNRDHELGTQSLFFSTTLSKLDYLGGRFTGNLLAAFAVLVFAALGILVASFMPWQDPERIVETRAVPYLYGLLIFGLPNLFFMASLAFALATLTRSTMAAYAGIVGFFVLNGVASVYVGGLERDALASLMDPFGLAAFARSTRYWTVFERNTLTPPLDGALLWNRLIWTAVGVLLLGLTQWRYRLQVSESGGFEWRFWRRWQRAAEAAPQPTAVGAALPVAAKSFGVRSRFAQWLYQTRGELRGIVRSLPFVVIALFGILNV
ncbi:MAG: ABC transporter permease subunit, partial [Myxococcota bacterium]